MTKETDIQTVVTTTSEPTEEQTPTEPVTEEVKPTISEDKINELINAKFEEVAKKHSEEIEKLKEQIDSKDKELENLKKINQQIILTANTQQVEKEITDFSSVDFDEVDWDKQSETYIEKLDSKIFN